jgi:hypothetical protein
MSVRLTYLQGSFRREERTTTVPTAIARAIHLMDQPNGCHSFAVRDGEGALLLCETQIRAEYEARCLRQNRHQELTTERAKNAKRSLRLLRRTD